jgi:hypothetical protein
MTSTAPVDRMTQIAKLKTLAFFLAIALLMLSPAYAGLVGLKLSQNFVWGGRPPVTAREKAWDEHVKAEKQLDRERRQLALFPLIASTLAAVAAIVFLRKDKLGPAFSMCQLAGLLFTISIPMDRGTVFHGFVLAGLYFLASAIYGTVVYNKALKLPDPPRQAA